MKKLIALLAVTCLSCKSEILFQAGSEKVVFEVLTDAASPHWVGSEPQGSTPVYLKFSKKSSTKSNVYFGLSGHFFGVLVEGLSVDPSKQVSIRTGEAKQITIKFLGKGAGVEITSNDDLVISLNREQVKELVDKLSAYWKSTNGNN